MTLPYAGYIRVSTPRQGSQGVSVPEQRAGIERCAELRNCTIGYWFEDQLTATKQGRPGFEAMMKVLRARKVAGVIIHKVDRSARNYHDWADIDALADRGFKVIFAHDGIDLSTRAGRLTAGLQATLATDYSRNLSDEVKKGLYGRFKQGFLPRPAPIGYLDQGGGRAKTIDPVAGPLVRELFELYASSRFSLRMLTAEADRRGLQRPKTGRRLRLAEIARMLRNPFYAGLIRVVKSGQNFAGVHEPLISPQLFHAVQSVLDGRSPRQVAVHDFLFRRMLVCAHCHKRLIGERQKGRTYYRCQQQDCPTTTVREDAVETHVLDILGRIQLGEPLFDEFKREAEELAKRDGDEWRERVRGLRLKMASLADRQQRMTDALIDGHLDSQDFEQRKKTLLMERRELEIALTATGASNAESTPAFLELAQRARLLYEQAPATEKRNLLETITSNRFVDGRTPMFRLAEPFDELSSVVKEQSGGAHRNTARTRRVLQRIRKALRLQVEAEPGRRLTDRINALLKKPEPTKRVPPSRSSHELTYVPLPDSDDIPTIQAA